MNNVLKFLKKRHESVIVFLGISIFIVLKIIFIVPRFGDGNAYFYMAKVFLEGILPYRDFFFADAPVLVLILTLITFISKGNIFLLQMVPIFFEAASAFLIFVLSRRFKFPLPWITSLIYLFCFSIFATSDYVTGVQLVIFFSLLGLFFWEKNKFFFSGIFWTLAILTKGYAFPAFLGLMVFGLFKKRYSSVFLVCLGSFLTALIILMPFFIISSGELIQSILIHHLNRPLGISKSIIFSFFLKREWLILLFSLPGFWFIRKTPIIWLAIPSLAFLLIFQDLYYLYLNSFFIYCIIGASAFIGFVWKKEKLWGNFLIILLFIFMLFSISYYFNHIHHEGKFLNMEEVSEYVELLTKNYSLYGSHEVAPLVALVSNKYLFENYIDTNVQTFGSGVHDVEKISEKAVEEGIYFIAIVRDYPEFNIYDFGFEGYFSRNIFDDYCKPLERFPISERREPEEFVAVYECVK